MKKAVNIVLCGAGGRMGREISALARRDRRVRISEGIDLENRERMAQALKKADVVVDFSSPAASVGFAAAAAKARVPIVVGTTGFTPSQARRLRRGAARSAVLLAPNCSPGMNLLFELARRASSALSSYRPSISETHHKGKKDAPSGSAKRLAEAVRAGRRNSKPVPTSSLRRGRVVGDHTLSLTGPDEKLELTHRAQHRRVFARGALQAAVWLAGKRPGLYTMGDLFRP